MLHHWGGDGFARPIQGKKIEQRGVAKILLNVCAAVQGFFINFGDRQTVAAEMAGEWGEDRGFFPHDLEKAGLRTYAAGKTTQVAPFTTERSHDAREAIRVA